MVFWRGMSRGTLLAFLEKRWWGQCKERGERALQWALMGSLAGSFERGRGMSPGFRTWKIAPSGREADTWQHGAEGGV